MIEKTSAIRALENTFDTFDLKGLETIEEVLQEKIKSKKEKEEEDKYNEAVKNIIDNLKEIEKLRKDLRVAFEVYDGAWRVIPVDWYDLRCGIEDNFKR